MPPTTLLVDLDGVLRLWPKDYTDLEATFGLPAGSIGKTAFEPALLQEVITGKMTDAAWRLEVERRLTLVHPAGLSREAIAAWSQPRGEVNAEVLRIVRDLRAACRIGLITNATDRLASDLTALDLLQHVDFIINSSQVGVAKPDQAIFKLALDRALAQPSEAALIDDTLANVTAARALGIRAHHFTGATGLRTFLQAVGLSANVA